MNVKHNHHSTSYRIDTTWPDQQLWPSNYPRSRLLRPLAPAKHQRWASVWFFSRFWDARGNTSKTHLLRYLQRVQAPRMMRAQHSQHNLYDIFHSIQKKCEKNIIPCIRGWAGWILFCLKKPNKIIRISIKLFKNITTKPATKLTLTRSLASCNNLRCAALSFIGFISSWGISSKDLTS